jgi:internalin A
MPIDPISTAAFVVGGRILLPFAASYLTSYFTEDTDCAKKLAECGVGIAGNLSANSIESFLATNPDFNQRLTNEHFMRYTGHVIGALITNYSKTPEAKAHRKDLGKLGSHAQEQWLAFVRRGAPDIEPLREDEFLQRLGYAAARKGSDPALHDVPFLPLLQWASAALKLKLRLHNPVLEKLALYLQSQLGPSLHSAIVSSDPDAEAAFKNSLLDLALNSRTTIKRIEHNQVVSAAQQMRDSAELKATRKDTRKTRKSAVKVQRTLKKQGKLQSATLGEVQALRREQAESALTPLGRYRRSLQAEFRYIEALHVPEPKDDQLREKWQKQAPLLTEAFVAPPCADERIELRDFTERTLEGVQPGQDLLPLLGEYRRIVLLADPGMGKSTLIRYLIHSLAQPELPERLPRVLDGKIPVPLILRDLMPALLAAQPDSQKWSWRLLLQVWRKWRPSRKGSALVEQAFSGEENQTLLGDYLKGERAYFLIDGLDEIGEEKLRKAMQWVIFEGYAESSSRARFLITSRVVGYEACQIHVLGNVFPFVDRALSNVDRKEQIRSFLQLLFRHELATSSSRSSVRRAIDELDEFLNTIGPRTEVSDLLNMAFRFTQTDLPPLAKRLYLTPFTDGHQKQFAHNIFDKRLGQSNAEGTLTDFLGAISEHQGVHIISRCPYVLLLLTVVYSEDLRLPEGRARVYARMAEIYLDKINQDALVHSRLGPIAQVPSAVKMQWLQLIAMHMQLRRTRKAEAISMADSVRGTDIGFGANFRSALDSDYQATAADVIKWMEPVVDASGYGGNRHAAAIAFADYLGERTGLFLPREKTLFEWMHNSVMEFFAAMYLRDQLDHASDLGQARRDADEFGQTFVLESYLKDNPAGQIPVTPADFPGWAADPRWHEVLIFLGESVGYSGKMARVQRLCLYLFPQLHSERSAALPLHCREFSSVPEDEEDAVPLMPLQAVALAVTLAQDQELKLPEATREHWWRTLWRAKQIWPNRYWNWSAALRWHIAPILLQRQDRQVEVLHCLAQAWNSLGREQPQSPFLGINLSECHALTSKVLWEIAGLRDLTELSLGHCTGLEDTAALAGLSGLLKLSMPYCTGLKGDNSLAGLPSLQNLLWLDLDGCTALVDTAVLAGLFRLRVLTLRNCTALQGTSALGGLCELRKLETLDLFGCTGITDTAALAGLTWLQTLYLGNCTGLQGSAALSGLRGLQDLRQLSLAGCTGLTEEDVDGLQQALGDKCKIHWP